MTAELWHDLGDAVELAKMSLQPALVGRTKVALSYADGSFGVIHNSCNHAGGPLGEGMLDGNYVVCPWHNYKFHRLTGEGEPGYEDDRVPRFASKVESGRLLVRDTAVTTRNKPAHACTWPCSISQMDADDGMNTVYDSLVFWADVVLVATPIRWGAASSLYFKMAERLNTVQNQITIGDRVMLKNKVAGFIVIGGQDNIQAVAGQMLQFFSELGMQFPQFPYIAHSRGWTAEDMECNVEFVKHSATLHDAPVTSQGLHSGIWRCRLRSGSAHELPSPISRGRS